MVRKSNTFTTHSNERLKYKPIVLNIKYVRVTQPYIVHKGQWRDRLYSVPLVYTVYLKF